MFSSNGSLVSSVAPDAQFNYVTMLLHGDGTNGAQNNTFIDSSTNAFSITRNGNTTQGSFSPYGSNWSNWFNGAEDYLSLGTSINLALGAGDFTIEVFLSVTAYNASTSNIFEWRSAGGVPSNIPTLYLSASGVPIFYASVGSGALITGSSAVALNTWTHLAIVRSGSTVTMYLDGTSVGSATNSANLGTQSFYINDPQGTFRHKGYFSNVRMVKGTAVYTTTFTPPTAPLTAITNTQLLTCQSARFIDNSTNNFTITVNGLSNEGHPIALKFNPFGASAAYSTGVVGGSGYFDGTGDYLSTTVTAKSAGTASFTYELWFYEQATDGIDRHLFTTRTSDTNAGFDCRVNSSGVINLQRGASTDFFTSAATANVACWNHLAIVRNGSTTLTIYLNGVSIGTASLGYDLTVTNYKIGVNYATDDAWKGYITDFRYTKAAVYTATFTPPTSPLTAITDTALLLNTINGAIFDNAMMNDLETVGNAQISTSVKKYGTGSLAFDGTGDALIAAYTPNFAFSSGNFTIEFWLYINTTSGTPIVFDMRDGGGSQTPVIYLNGSALVYYTNSGVRITGGTLSTGTWYHVAVCRSGTSTKMFLDGTQIGSTYTDSTNYSGGNLWLGSYYSGGFDLNGYIDDLRITKGYARYTATFTPPTAALSDTGPY